MVPDAGQRLWSIPACAGKPVLSGVRPMPAEVRLLANLCEVAPRAVEELDLRDYEALQREYSRFQTISAADARRAVLALAARTGWALGEMREFDVAELAKWLEGLAALTASATAGAAAE